MFIQTDKHLYECLITCHCQSEKKMHLSIIYCQTVSFWWAVVYYVCSENCMSGFSTAVLNLSKSGNIFFRQMPNGDCLFTSASLSSVGSNSLAH